MAKRLYVGNIPFKATEEELREFFSSVGEVESVRMILVPQTGQPKGFAFIEMTSEDEAKKTIAALNGKPFMGRELRVSEARPSRPLEQRIGYGGLTSYDRMVRSQERFRRKPRSRKDFIVNYFVKKNKIHCYPVPQRCNATYHDEQLRDTIPHGVEECPYCMRKWPESRQ